MGRRKEMQARRPAYIFLETTGSSSFLTRLQPIMNFRIVLLFMVVASGLTRAQVAMPLLDSLNTQTLDEVILIDSRFPLKRSQSGRMIEKIDAETLKKFQGLDLGEVLRSKVGIDILGSRSQLGQNLTTSIRGGRNDQVLILVDGIRVNDPSRIGTDFNINFLPLDAIASIEILKGAAGTLYGSAAATGVINIITKKGTSQPLLSWNSSVGTLVSQAPQKGGISAVENSVRLSEKLGMIDFSAFYSQRYADGMSAVVGGEPDLFARNNFGIALGLSSLENYTLRLTAHQDDIRNQYDGFDANFAPADANNTLLTNLFRFTLQQNYQYDIGEIQLDLGYQKTKRDFQSDFPINYVSSNVTLDLSNRIVFNDKLYGIMGYFLQQNKATIVEEEEILQNDLYLNIIYSNAGFNFSLGGRWNHHDAYGSAWTYNLNPSYNFSFDEVRSLKVFASLGSGFNTPSLYQLYDPYSGNDTLEPEESQTQEIGLSYTYPSGSLTAAYFKRTENPTLVYDFETFRYANSSTAVFYSGMELRYEYQLSNKWEMGANYTYTETEGGDLRRIPKHAYRMEIDFTPDNIWNIATSLSRTGERLAADFTTTLAAYFLWDLRIQYQVPKTAISFFVHATNLLNTDYVEFLNYSSRGRNFMAGFRFTL